MKFERSDEDVGNRVFKGALFLTGARLILRLFSLVNLVILGRLLAPEDYGVASLAIVVIGLTQVLSDIRVNSALISMREIDKTHLDTGFTINLIRGVVIGALLFAFAGPIADYMNEPRLENVMRVICIVLIFDGARNPAFIMFQRNIDFSKEFRRRTLATLLATLFAVAFAIVTKSYWAIVAGTLAERFTEMAFSYWRIPYRPRFGFKEWRAFVGFGSWMTLDAIVAYFTQVAPQFLVGKYLGSAQLGYFTVGSDISQVATRELAGPLTQAVFPGLAALAHNNNRLRSAYRKAQATILGIAMPIGIGTSLMANELISILVGVKWLPASQVVVLLAPAIAFSMIASASNGLAMAKLALRAMLVRTLVVAAIAMPLYAYAVFYHGFIGVLYALLFRILLQTAVNVHFAKLLIGDSFFSPIIASWRTLLSVTVMAVAVTLTPAPFAPGQDELTIILGMLPRVLLGAGVYILMHVTLWMIVGKPDGFEAKLLEVGLIVRDRVAARFAR